MSNTINAINLTGTDWQNANTLSGIAVGTAVVLQNQSSSHVMCAVSGTKPALGFVGQILPADLSVMANVAAGESTIWLLGRGPVSMQAV